MTDMIKSLIRRDPRYEIKSNSELTVSISRSDGSSRSIDAELLNISAGGAKFKVKQAIGVEDIVSVRIEVSHPSRIIAKSGRVCWVAPFTGDDWWLGCAFDQPIDYKILHELAVSGVLERRRHRRERVNLETEAKWELSSETVDVRILNYSPGGGFCMASSIQGKPGERVLLRLKLDERREYLVCGSVRWQVESGDGYLIGCEFVHSRNSAVLSEVLATKRKGSFMSRQWLTSRTQVACRRWPLPLGVTAIAATVLFGPLIRPAGMDTPPSETERFEPVSIATGEDRPYDVGEASDVWVSRSFDEPIELHDLRLSQPTELVRLSEGAEGLPLLETFFTQPILGDRPTETLGPRLGDDGDW